MVGANARRDPPAHLLLVGESIVGVLDWTTVAVGDPVKDFMPHRVTVSPCRTRRLTRRSNAMRNGVDASGRSRPSTAPSCTRHRRSTTASTL